MNKRSRKIMIVAGEVSGDVHAAKLVEAIREAEPQTEFEFFGASGPKMRETGVEAIVESDRLSVVGLAEIGLALPMFIRAFRDLKKAAMKRRPNAVILVDFPDFNLKLARFLKKKGFLTIYYISPQIWAWRKYRISAIKKHVDLMLTILPFEKDWYVGKGVKHVEYVGSPLASEVSARRTKDEFCRDHGLAQDLPIISLLPGSRYKEIARILPVQLLAAAKVTRQLPKAQFVIPLASEIYRPQVDEIIAKFVNCGIEPIVGFTVVENETFDALNASDVAAVTSGTATLETGIIGTPQAIVYKSSLLNYVLLKPLISVEHYGLINLIAGERLAKELIQYEFTPLSLAKELLRIMKPDENAAMRARIKAAMEKLGHGGASKRAAAAVLGLIRSKNSD